MESEIENENNNNLNKKSTRGRKPKYHTEEERKAAKRLQNRQYKQRKLEKLIAERKSQVNIDDKN